MRVEVSGRQFIFPQQCACCAAPPDTLFSVIATRTTGKRVVHTKSNSWQFPYCSRCVSHVKALRDAEAAQGAMITASVVVALFFFFAVAHWFGLFSFLAALAASLWLGNSMKEKARAICNAQCACVTNAVAFLGWDGTRNIFEISSPQYALAFMVSNQKKLVNISPQAHQLLSANGHGWHANAPQSAQRYST